MRWCPFIKQTTRFGPCAGPSSALNLRVGVDYTVRVARYKLNEISLFFGTVMFVKL